MTIQFNAGNNLTVHEAFREKLTGQLTEELSRFSENITRVEIYLIDELGDINGINDKGCLLEARVERRKPFVVTDNAGTYEQALSGASGKLNKTLDSIFGTLANH